MVAIGRIASNYMRLIFDPRYMENVTRSLKVSKHVAKKAAANGVAGKGFYSNIGKNMKDAFVYAERQAKVGNKSLWQTMMNQARTLFPDISKSWTTSKGLWSKLKGVGKQIGRRMPLIGAVLTVAFELPNIVSAFKDKGFIGGIAEIGKSGARLGGFMAGMAIGQALIPIPIVGGLVGGMLGDWLVSKVVGKSYSEQKAEAEQAANEMVDPNATSMNVDPTNGANPAMMPTLNQQQLAEYQKLLYGGMNNFNDDFMMNATGMNQMNQMYQTDPMMNSMNQFDPMYQMNRMPRLDYSA